MHNSKLHDIHAANDSRVSAKILALQLGYFIGVTYILYSLCHLGTSVPSLPDVIDYCKFRTETE